MTSRLVQIAMDILRDGKRGGHRKGGTKGLGTRGGRGGQAGTSTLTIRMTHHERELAKEYAEAEGLSLSAFARWSMFREDRWFQESK